MFGSGGPERVVSLGHGSAKTAAYSALRSYIIFMFKSALTYTGNTKLTEDS